MNLTTSIRFFYVSTKQINKIKKQAGGNSLWEWIKIELKVGKFIMSEGYKQSKKQISFFYKNYSSISLTPEQKQQIYLTKNNLWKVPPIATLFMIPGGLPLVLFYMALFPSLTPTWFLRDSEETKLVNEKLGKKREALEYFINCGSIVISEKQKWVETTLSSEVFRNMSYEQQKKVMEMCYGQTFDGTNIIRKSIGLNLNSLISPTISSYIMKNNMDERLRYCQNTSDLDQDQLKSKVIKQVKNIMNWQNKETHFIDSKI